jgi:hypothetical protein
MYTWIDNRVFPLPDCFDSPYEFLHWVHTNQILQIKVHAYLKLKNNLTYFISFILNET